MLERFTRWNSWLGGHMFIGVLSALFLGFLITLPDAPALNTLAVVLFSYMTFVTALGTSLRDFLQVLNKPWIPLWSLFLIHIIVPLVAWIMGLVFYPGDFAMRLGFLISASIPIGVTSIIWTSVARGDVALALVVVTLDTLIVPIWIPTFFSLIVGKTIHIDFWHLLLQLLWMVTIPSIVGMVVNDMTHGKMLGFSRSVGGFTAKLSMFIVVFINSAMIAPQVRWSSSLVKMLAVLFILATAGYALGYLGSLVLRNRQPEKVATMVYNVGMRNISFGAVLAIGYFSPAVAIPVTLAMLYQQPLAAIVSYWFKHREGTPAVAGDEPGL